MVWEDCRRELTLVGKDGQDLDTTRRSLGQDRAFQMGNGKEMSGGSRHQFYLGGRESSFRLERRVYTDRHWVVKQKRWRICNRALKRRQKNLNCILLANLNQPHFNQISCGTCLQLIAWLITWTCSFVSASQVAFSIITTMLIQTIFKSSMILLKCNGFQQFLIIYTYQEKTETASPI